MPEIIPIQITSQELLQRAERIARARRFERVDRVPVSPNFYMRYWLPLIGVSCEEYFGDPEVMLRAQIYGQKWILENIQSDHLLDSIYVDFQNALDPSALGCETVMGPDGLIWVTEGWVRTERDLETLKAIDPLKTGLAARALEYAEQMRAVADRYVVHLADGQELRLGERPQVNLGTLGPFTVAAQLAGMAELCEALLLEPNFARSLLTIVTDKVISMLQYCRQAQGMVALKLADDFAGNLSPKQFKEFVLPCLQRIRSEFADLPLRFHMCGKVDHLIPLLASEFAIDEFSMFGYQVNKQLVQVAMGGRIVLLGNVNPMNLLKGTPESVLSESLEALRAFGQYPGGFILSDGANIAPGSPPENISAMWEATRKFAAEGL